MLPRMEDSTAVWAQRTDAFEIFGMRRRQNQEPAHSQEASNLFQSRLSLLPQQVLDHLHEEQDIDDSGLHR